MNGETPQEQISILNMYAPKRNLKYLKLNQLYLKISTYSGSNNWEKQGEKNHEKYTTAE